jgi:hypothetical protein
MTVDKSMSVDFIAGYIYRAIQYASSKETKGFKEFVTDGGFVGEVVVPNVWICGYHHHTPDILGFCTKVNLVLESLQRSFSVMYAADNIKLVTDWEENYISADNHLVINYRVYKHSPKKMTVSEIEKKLGYKIEIVSEE